MRPLIFSDDEPRVCKIYRIGVSYYNIKFNTFIIQAQECVSQYAPLATTR